MTIEDRTLAERAARAGVATEYADWARRRVEVAPEAVEATLAVVGSPAPSALVSAGPAPVAGKVLLEDGLAVDVAVGDPLPEGVHRLVPADVPLVVAPPALPDPLGRRAWGWQVQLYQLRSARSWGIGDYADLATLARALAAQGADILLVNPMHALTPVHPVQPSPYFPSSRRFADQVAVAVDLLPEYLAAGPALRAEVDALKPPNGDRIDRDAVWRAKRAAFAMLLPASVPAGSEELEGFAVFCALAEEHGADRRSWPAPLHRPGPAATAAADPDRVRLHRWIQLRATEQLDAAQRAAREAGMAVGVVHDLAVGVDPVGADSWLLPDDLASGATVGAPPDSFNQLGQDWGFPPFRPDRLAETGFAAYRQVVQAALRHGGGMRVDHVMGLFRLWWVPLGRGAAGGTYVRYDAPAMLAVLVLEASRAGALVVGEDLGTVDPAIRTGLDRVGVLGSAVLWYSREDDEITPLTPGRYRERAVASLSTHDLPTAYGFLASEQVRVRAELGQLDRPVEEEVARVAEERDRLFAVMRAEGLAAPGLSDEELVLDMYRLLTRTPCRVVLAAPADVVGDLRQPNLPGTTDEYPNWQLPLADRSGAPVSLEDFLAAPGTARLARLLDSALRP